MSDDDIIDEADRFTKLIGLNIKQAFISDDAYKIVLMTYDNVFVCIEHQSHCCEAVFFAHVNHSENLIGAIITGVEPIEWNDSRQNEANRYDKGEGYIGSAGIKLTTTRGNVSLETRVEGSGNYDTDLCIDDEEIKPSLTGSIMNHSKDLVGTIAEVSNKGLAVLVRHKLGKGKYQEWHHLYKKIEDF